MIQSRHPSILCIIHLHKFAPLILPPQIGHTHGSLASHQVSATISFYASLFQRTCNLTWPAVLAHAATFEKTAKEKWPAYHEEMRGIAHGAERELLEIVAINVRSEITFGLGAEAGWKDGCTALGWRTQDRSWLAQNWDVRLFSFSIFLSSALFVSFQLLTTLWYV